MKRTGLASGVTAAAPPPRVGDGVAAGVSETVLPAAGEARGEAAEAGIGAALSAAAALAVAALVAYAGYSTVKELHTGDSPGASQFQHASSSNTTSLDTCRRFVAGSYMRYALDPIS